MPTGWETWRLFLDEVDRALEYEREMAADPISCPIDGEPLRTNGAGVLYCPFGGTGHVAPI